MNTAEASISEPLGEKRVVSMGPTARTKNTNVQIARAQRPSLNSAYGKGDLTPWVILGRQDNGIRFPIHDVFSLFYWRCQPQAIN